MEPAFADQSQVLMEIDTLGEIRVQIDSKEVAPELMHQPALRRTSDRSAGWR